MNGRHTQTAPNLPPRSLIFGIVFAFSLSSSAIAGDPSSLGESGLYFGVSLGSALLIQSQNKRRVDTAPDDYTRLAQRVQAQINEGRASSGVVSGYFNFQTAALAYTAGLDPEPISKGTAALAAWGSKLAGDAIAKDVLDKAQEDARGILAEGLKESRLSNEQLRSMSADQLRAKVRDLQIGGKSMRDVFRDNPQALEMLEAESADLANRLGVENLARTATIGTDVNNVKIKVESLQKNLAAYQDEVSGRLSKVESGLGTLAQNAEIANAKLNELKDQMAGNTTAIRSLAAISYSGWSTSQKLQAAESGLFPEISGDNRAKLIASLKAQQSLENTVADLQNAANTFGNLATITSNLGVSGDVVKSLETAQSVAGDVAKFATGDVLGGIAGLTSLVGLGGPDAGAQRHAETMKYLHAAFAEVNQKLDRVIDLQIKTLDAIAELAKAQEQFRQQVTQQLNRIESAVLENQLMLQNIIMQRWISCHDLFYGTVLNGQFQMGGPAPTRDFLVSLLKANNLPTSTADCYREFTTFLDARVKPAQWNADIIAAELFPTDDIVGDVEFQTLMRAYKSQEVRAFSTARNFLIQAMQSPKLPKRSAAEVLARLMQPMADVDSGQQLNAVFTRNDVKLRFQNFKCNDSGTLAPPLVDLLCVGTLPNSPNPPVKGRFQTVLNAPLIGPNAYWLIDMGISLANIVDFASRGDDGTFRFVRADEISRFVTEGAKPDLLVALREGKGAELLTKLRWLADATVLQQSLTYGDYVPELIEQVMYDPEKKALSIDSSDADVKGLKESALAAMKANPILARNVLLKALRHSIADGAGGTERAAALSYEQSYFALGIRNYISSNPCNGPDFAKSILKNLFPNFSFGYRVTREEKDKADKKDCPLETTASMSDNSSTPGYGAGVSIDIADFYATVPSPFAVAKGVYEQAPGLRVALAYRDRVSQALIDRNFSNVLTASLSGTATREHKEDLAFELLTRAWTSNVGSKSM